jgi:hypothetical protein
MNTPKNDNNSEPIKLSLNSPESKQTFVPYQRSPTKIALTTGVLHLMEENGETEITTQLLLAIFTEKLKTVAQTKKLDYFQKAKVYNKDTWIIDDGEVITWLLPEEY